MRRASIVAIVVALLLSLRLVSKSGSFLVVNDPRPSDVILVLAGETNHRPQLALQLLSQNYGREVILDVPTNSMLYEFTQVQLAERYIRDLPQPARVTICPIDGLSTKDEAKDARKCLARKPVKTVLIVTSDFHTRRALSTFRKELPEYSFSTAAAFDAEQFGDRWWKRRQWAKTSVDEWLRLLWWKTMDEWR